MALSSESILLAGATGMVGAQTLRRLLANAHFTGTIIAPTRRALQTSDSRLVCLETDFSPAPGDVGIADALRLRSQPGLAAFVSCLGTTIKSAGSREAFIAVDRELVLRLAQTAFECGARHAIVVSSVGASRQSGNFYLRVKGEVEDALAKIGFDRLDILQPGLLLGERSERRPGEALAQVLAPLVNPAMWGKLRRYRAIDADDVAAAIVRLLELVSHGHFVHLHDSIRELSGGRSQLT